MARHAPFLCIACALALTASGCGGRLAPDLAACADRTSCEANEGAPGTSQGGGFDAGAGTAPGSGGGLGKDSGASVDAQPPHPVVPTDAGGIHEDAAPPDGSCAPGRHEEGDGGCVPNDPAAGLGSAAPCLAGGDILHIEAEPDSYIYAGTENVPGPWAIGAQSYVSLNDVLLVEVTPNKVYANMWSVTFMTETLKQPPKTGFVYYPTQSNYAMTDPYGVPVASFALQNGSLACVDQTGAFVLDTYEASDAGDFGVLTARFWMHCPGHSGIVRGCVHYDGNAPKPQGRALSLMSPPPIVRIP